MTTPTLISEKDMLLLAHLELSPTLGISEVARRLRQKSTSVSYALRLLWERGSITQRAFVNGYALGFSEIAMYFSLTEQSADARLSLIDRIVAHDRVIFFGALFGDYHYVVVFLCKSFAEMPDFMRELFSGYGDLFSDKLIAPRLSSHRFARKYFNPELPRAAAITAEPTSEIVAIDSLDADILHQVGNCGFESLRAVAREIGAPFSTVERRVERLVKSQVIRSFYLAIEESVLGVQSFRLLVAKKGICNSTQERLLEFCRNHPQVVYLIEALGAWDFEIGIEVRNSEEVRQIIEELHGVCGMRIGWIKALTEGKSFKCSRFPFRVESEIVGTRPAV